MALRGISIDAASQTIPSPTFTGTVTFPDGSTWTSTGANHVTVDTINLNTGSPIVPASTGLNIVGADAGAPSVTIVGYGGIPFFRTERANGTGASPTAILNTQTIGQWTSAGYDGVTPGTFSGTGNLQWQATEDWSSGHHGAKAIISTVAVASTTVTATLTLNNPSATGIQFNGYTTAGLLSNDASGNVATTNAPSVTGGITAFSGTAPPASGTGAVGISFSNTATLGVYCGTGAPTFSAAKGALYLNTTATTTTTRLYINSSGSTTWTTFTTAA